MRRSVLFISLALLLTSTASAAVYSDVPSASPYATAITSLTDAGVITGNPDGTYRPLNPLNRVAVLKMAYKAAGREPAVSSGNCFPKEFSSDAWFATYVCDALARKFVKGYTDGTFRPNGIVTLGEALKMIYTVLEIPAPAATAEDVDLLPFRLSPFHWAAPYIVSAYKYEMLPLPDVPANLYTVDDPIDRGQAALLIYKARMVKQNLHVNESSASSSSSSEQSSVPLTSSLLSSSSSSDATDATATVPWAESATFNGVEPRVYRFHLTEDTMIDVNAYLIGFEKENISCRLYRLVDDAPSDEFYTGLMEGSSCYLHTMLEAGKYQIELTPSIVNVGFRVSVTAGGDTDSNDGLHDAILMPVQKLRSGVLAANDLEDWYAFTVSTEQNLSVEMTSDGNATCSVYPWTDVDLESFENPTCNKPFLYPVGTYYVRIAHGAPRASRQTYTIIVRAQ
jgi:hypothetical protein